MPLPVRSLGALASLLGWIPAGLILTLLWLDGSHHEGYRPELSELTGAAVVFAAVAGLALGYVHGARTRAGADASTVGRRLAVVLVAVAVAAVTHLAANEALYRYVIPLGEDLRHAGPTWPVGVVVATGVSAVGFGLGLLRSRLAARRVGAATPTTDTGAPTVPGRRWLVGAALIGLVGLLTVPAFVRVGAELATTRFVPAGAPTVDNGRSVTLVLPPGRYAVFRSYGDNWSAEQCAITDAAGRRLVLSEPAVLLTDNGDSIVTMLLGTVDVSGAGPITFSCQDEPYDTYQVAGPPEIRGPLEPLVYAPWGLLSGIGLLPGAVLAAWVFARRRSPRLAQRTPLN